MRLLLPIIAIVISFASCQLKRKSDILPIHPGRYSGPANIDVDTVGDDVIATFYSSQSEVYETDNDFYCRLVMVQTGLKQNNTIRFKVLTYNDRDTSYPGGIATIQFNSDTTLILTLYELHDEFYHGFGSCNASYLMNDPQKFTLL